MPYPRQHTYVTWFGDAFSQAEEWQVGLRLDQPYEPPSTDTLNALDAAFATLVGANVSFPAGRRYLGLKVAPQDVNGRYPDGVDATEFLRAVPLSGAASVGYPQIALVLSLRTARSRGYASNGRMYIPSSLSPDAGTGLITASAASNAALAGAAFIGEVNDAGAGVASVMSTVGTGRIEPITGVRVGRVMDTQRRRRNGLPETYTPESPVPL